MSTPLPDKNSKRRKLLIITGGITGATVLLLFGIGVHNFSLIPGMFKLNKECQEEGYYMAEFEFKMLGLCYYIDKGEFGKAISCIRKLHKQLTTREGLIKVPDFKDKKQELEFYRNLQNPGTGAFMDDAYPLCSYTGPTGNVLNHLDALAHETGQPLTLKYPLKYLDELNTPEKLKIYLDDIANVGWLASQFPQTSFHFTRCLLSLFYEDTVVEKYQLYKVSPQWKKALLQWFYENQDPQTGLWGPRSKNGKLRKMDSMNSASILKAFIDSEGRNLHKEFPLRYREQLAQSCLKKSFDPIPKDEKLDEWHEWNLNTSKSMRTLIWLWDGLSDKTKADAKKLMENFIRIKFEKFYIEEEGAFSYYPKSRHATLDGTGGTIGNFNKIGVFSEEKQIRLWGHPKVNCADLDDFSVSEITENDVRAICNAPDINSLRFYAIDPGAGNYTAQVLGVCYPKKTCVLDVMEVVPKIRTWINGTSQSMGNWTSREKILNELATIKIEPVPISRGKIPLEKVNKLLRENGTLVLIGFNVLQIPICKMTFHAVAGMSLK